MIIVLLDGSGTLHEYEWLHCGVGSSKCHLVRVARRRQDYGFTLCGFSGLLSKSKPDAPKCQKCLAKIPKESIANDN